jgi:hypothetical protein
MRRTAIAIAQATMLKINNNSIKNLSKKTLFVYHIFHLFTILYNKCSKQNIHWVGGGETQEYGATFMGGMGLMGRMSVVKECWEDVYRVLRYRVGYLDFWQM